MGRDVDRVTQRLRVRRKYGYATIALYALLALLTLGLVALQIARVLFAGEELDLLIVLAMTISGTAMAALAVQKWRAINRPIEPDPETRV